MLRAVFEKQSTHLRVRFMGNKSTPLISIVLPVFNGVSFLAGSIESCLKQTHSNLELIVVDDASTDSTPDVIARYCQQDARVRYVRNPANVKLPASLNRGFQLARGSLLTWTSDDNEYFPEALAEMSRSLVRHPRVGLVYADMMLMNKDGRDFGVARQQPPSQMGFRGNVVGGCFLYRRELGETLGPYPTDLFLVEDYYYWLRAVDLGRLLRIPKTLYRYRTHEQSLSSRFANRRGIGRVALERALQLTRRRTLRAGIYCNMAFDDFAGGQYELARIHLWRAMHLAPLSVIRFSSKKMLWNTLWGSSSRSLSESDLK